MEYIVGAMIIAGGIYLGLLSIANGIIRGAVILADRRDLEKRIEEQS